MDQERIPLLGRRASEEIQLIKVQDENILTIDSIVIKELSTTIQESNSDDHMTREKIKTEFENISKDDGCLEGEYNIEIDNSMPPVKLPKHRVPVAMMTPLKEELKNLEKRGIITSVEESTDWISSMFSVKKTNGKKKISIDPKLLNRALKRSHFPLPTFEDILHKLSRAKVFTVY